MICSLRSDDLRLLCMFLDTQNSWNSDWGEEGYYRLEAGHNKCGLANDAVHSKV